MSITLSDKFKKELVNFFKWVELYNYTITLNEIEQEWSLALCPEYIEPGRYKMIVFIEEILKNYNIYLDNTEIVDAKQMDKNFKKYKPTKTNKTTTNKIKTKITNLIINDNTLDTSTNGMICELTQNTKKIEKIFGCKAKFTGNENTDHRYEWKFYVNDNVYSIYDWSYCDGTFDEYNENTWFLGGDTHNLEHIKFIKDILSNVKNITQPLNLNSESKPIELKSQEFVYDSENEDFDFTNIKTVSIK